LTFLGFFGLILRHGEGVRAVRARAVRLICVDAREPELFGDPALAVV
jgi:hypothetical protein